eukprot:284814717_6
MTRAGSWRYNGSFRSIRRSHIICHLNSNTNSRFNFIDETIGFSNICPCAFLSIANCFIDDNPFSIWQFFIGSCMMRRIWISSKFMWMCRKTTIRRGFNKLQTTKYTRIIHMIRTTIVTIQKKEKKKEKKEKRKMSKKYGTIFALCFFIVIIPNGDCWNVEPFTALFENGFTIAGSFPANPSLKIITSSILKIANDRAICPMILRNSAVMLAINEPPIATEMVEYTAGGDERQSQDEGEEG